MASRKRRPLLERFQEKIEISKDNDWNGSPCWDWTGARDTDGYGRFGIDGKTHLSHRVSWEIHRGPLPEGLCVLHQCDRPCCVNPDHLFLGTIQDNAEDREAKGRGNHPKGSNNGRAILTETDVRLIKHFLERCKVRGAAAFLSRWLGVEAKAISEIKNGRNWTHVE